MFPEALFVDLLYPDVYREMSARPERLRELVLGSPQRVTVVVDEVQRVPELLNVVHALIEQPVRRQCVLTGSSARKLRRGGIDLLAGRALYYTLHPFMAAERPSFQLSTALQTGLLPLVVAMARVASGPSRSRIRPGCAPRICTPYKALSATTQNASRCCCIAVQSACASTASGVSPVRSFCVRYTRRTA